MKLQKYDFDLEYSPGKTMIVSDTLSWAYLSNQSSEIDEAELVHSANCCSYAYSRRYEMGINLGKSSRNAKSHVPTSCSTTKGNEVRRNRRHLLPCKEKFRPTIAYDDDIQAAVPAHQQPGENVKAATTNVIRSGRVIRKPARYDTWTDKLNISIWTSFM